jgi:DNA-binding transcriptional MerR regulator
MGQAAEQKRDSAYKTISEVAELLGIQQHVLRFWESRFPEVKPLKRNGGRRFYRPEDVTTLRRIKTLLYEEGYTINGARQHLREHSRPAVTEMPVSSLPLMAKPAGSPTPSPSLRDEPPALSEADDITRHISASMAQLSVTPILSRTPASLPQNTPQSAAALSSATALPPAINPQEKLQELLKELQEMQDLLDAELQAAAEE